MTHEQNRFVALFCNRISSSVTTAHEPADQALENGSSIRRMSVSIANARAKPTRVAAYRQRAHEDTWFPTLPNPPSSCSRALARMNIFGYTLHFAPNATLSNTFNQGIRQIFEHHRNTMSTKMT